MNTKNSKGDNALNTEMRDELLDLPINAPAFELAGFICAARTARKGSTAYISTPRLPVMRRAMKLLKHLNVDRFNAKIATSDKIENSDANDLAYSLCQHDGRASFQMHERLYGSIVSSARSISSDDEGWMWLRGAWCTAGAIYLPQNGYCMYMRFLDARKTAERASDILRRAGMTPTSRMSGKGLEVMLRHQEQIVTALTMMGFVRTALALEETAIMRSLRSRANKIVNCDSANIDKTVSAAREHMKLLERVERGDLWRALPAQLAELGRARMSNPTASLRELGQMLSSPVSKSTVEYRWKKLASIVDVLEQKQF